MRKLPLILSGLFFAYPAAAQDAPAPSTTDKVELKDEAPAPKPDASSVPTSPGQESATSPATAPAAAPGPTAAKPRAVAATTTVSGPAAVVNDDSWKFEFHGYIRAPMRLGIGKRDNPGPGQSKTTFHTPVIPDDQYLSWQSTPHNKTDWAELYFSIGNSWAKGTVSVQGYDFYQGSYGNPSSQLGVSDGYVDLTPDLGYENVRLSVRAGAFSNKYGSAGKYDAGEYDTYMFGRVHNAGEALHIDYDIDENNSLWIEHGVGVKKPDPSQFNNTRFTMLHHMHLGFKHTEAIQFSAHYLNSWTQEEERNMDPGAPATAIVKTNAGTSVTGVPDGRMWVAGVDGRFDLGAFGYLYGAYSHVGLKDALTVGRAIEVIHSSGGGEFGLGVVDNYLGLSCVGAGGTTTPYFQTAAGAAGLPPSGIPADRPCSSGNGGIDTLLAQYEFDLTNFQQQISGGQKFWGEGSDLVLKLYGMYNKVKSDVPTTDGTHKLKYGADLAYAALPWLTAAVRFDRLQPNNRIPEQSFSILSPRLVFKSKWVTREAITLQYSRYMYNQRTCATGNPADATYELGQDRCVQPPSSPSPPSGFGSNYQSLPIQRAAPTTRPDESVVKIEATMWW
jgi:hypothetical protein